MLQAYIRGALGRAHYEILEDDGSYYGDIPDFEGVVELAEREISWIRVPSGIGMMSH